MKPDDFMSFAHLPDIVLRIVPETRSKYAAGTDGKIYCFSKARVNAKKPAPFMVSEAIGSAGYPFVNMIFERKRKSYPVHRLVCLAFHGTPQAHQLVVRHLDGNALNNSPNNLAWGTYAENEADKRRHGRAASGEAHGQAKLTEEGVRIIRAAIPAGLWNASDAAKVFGVCPSTIRRIAAGKVGWADVATTPANIDSLPETIPR